jgi:hypothetical protein
MIATKRAASDKLMLMVSSFAIVGATAVVFSFAAKKPLTTQPGTIPASSLNIGQIAQQTTIGFEVRSGLRYCLQSAATSPISAHVQFLNSMTMHDMIIPDQSCFTATQSDMATVRIDSPDPQLKALNITGQ